VAAVEEVYRQQAVKIANERLVSAAVGKLISVESSSRSEDVELVEQVAVAYELAAVEGIDALLYQSSNQQNKDLRAQAEAGAYWAYEFKRVLPLPENTEERLLHVLHLSALAYSADRWSDLRRWLADHCEDVSAPSVAEALWDKRILIRLYDCWIRLLRKNSWDDLDRVREIIAGLREDQKTYEQQFLSSEKDTAARALAFRLIALYHWAKGTELLSVYMLQGEPAEVISELDHHFEASREAAMSALDHTLEVLLRWLHLTARRMVANSLWNVAHSVNSRVTKFVGNAVKAQALFELLPPQRAALQEQGLLDQANRAVVIDMPTSGGKTILAQFRILQALNQFDALNGWVAYVAPTRALVAQLTRRLRRDFNPIGIQVEQLTSAVEIDTFEEELLSSNDKADSFQVLVATPEKLHLIINNKKIPRPLALVVMDEAHNIEDEERGLRIELLLATIKRDCPSANFLLLMPNVPNASELTNWLSPGSGKTISIGTSAWRPNDRVVGMFTALKEDSDIRGDWSLQFETLTSTPNTVQLKGKFRVGPNKPLDIPFTNAKSLTNQAGAMAKVFSERGTSVAVARTIRDTWSMARTVAKSLEEFTSLPPEISLVQRFLAAEISPQFELIGLLSKGVGVHHAGLSDESRSLIEWLAEEGKLRVLCATTTIAQGINFPVSSVFLASRLLPIKGSKEMPTRSFWNLAGRAGRIGQDSVGVVGLAAGDKPYLVRQYVSRATGDLVSRLVSLLDNIEGAQLNDLSLVIEQEQWSDFRSYVAHLCNEKKDIDDVLAETEKLLRNTFGYGTLQSRLDNKSKMKARALLDATKKYARRLSSSPENAELSDTTGFAPEGVQTALKGLSELGHRLTPSDWEPTSLFGPTRNSPLPQLIGIMLRIPELRKNLEELGSHGTDKVRIAAVAQAWVMGRSIEEIAREYFSGTPKRPIALTEAISAACRGIYRTLANAGTWGLSALSKMPSSGLNMEELSEESKRQINNLPAMLYHGVKSEAAVLMRMNSVPRSIAESLGQEFVTSRGSDRTSARVAREFLLSMGDSDWERVTPKNSHLSGGDYKKIWSRLSGDVV
jgi:superfamily II DNA/RNA helicase